MEGQEINDEEDSVGERLCCICLAREFTADVIGVPDCCGHRFCGNCLNDWSRESNTCPLDRMVFAKITFIDVATGHIISIEDILPQRIRSYDDLSVTLMHAINMMGLLLGQASLSNYIFGRNRIRYHNIDLENPDEGNNNNNNEDEVRREPEN